jgi:bacterioferritin
MTAGKDDIIAMLNEDMRGEHQAIVQYLLHAYAMEEGGLPCEIEAIARDEMRHFDWLADAIVELGRTPTIERMPVKRTGDHAANMRLDVAAEEQAIALYEQHIAAIDDPKIQRVLERIIHDEKAHHKDFLKFVDEAAAMTAGEGSEPTDAPQPDPAKVEILDEGIKHEYTVILQYLQHSFVTPHCDISRELEMQAINEMQHLGWLAEKMAAVGGAVDIERTAVNQSLDTEKMLAADIRAEQAVTAVYNEQIEAIDDEGLKQLIARIRDHEIYHAAVFTDLLQSLRGEANKAQPPVAKRFTVGSLKK